jgi:hypothetical protein
MMIPARDASGQWQMWRVGRQRIAWRPRSSLRYIGREEEYYPWRIVDIVDICEWLAALLSTFVVLPYRMFTGKWPVVGYMLNPIDRREDGYQRTPPLNRSEADGIVQQWAQQIEQYGHLTGDGLTVTDNVSPPDGF